MNNTENNAAITADLKKTISGIAGVNPGKAAVNDAWLSNIDKLCQRILATDPADFVQWDVISRTMVVGNADFVPGELAFLQGLPDWETRWKNVLKESLVGNPVLYDGFPGSSGNLIHQAYHLAHFEQKTGEKISDCSFVLEFGGGYGSMCRLVRSLGFKGRYVIFDLPPLSALQRYVLRMNGIPAEHSAEAAAKDPGTVICASGLEMLKQLLAGRPEADKAAFIATWSLSESPVPLRREILPLLKGFRHFLVAYQGLFGEVDNDAFFKEWAASLPGTAWHQWKIPHLPNQRYRDNFYLMGKKKS